ncbi:MAG: hypothetical protein M1836_000442 [Candelina mexicana]|nr:MAG: hypothetical protein M1836_000442 [Candelina mexicana]
MATTEDGWHSLDDGFEVFTTTWKPTGETLAKMVFLHGFSDHSHRYYSFFPTLASRGIEVLSFDQRGWGRSVTKPSQRGLTGPTSLVMSDITSVLSAQLPSPVPLFLMGHSMGGGECLTYACTGPPHILSHIRGYLAESPLIALHPAAEPLKLTVTAGRLAARVMPHYHMVQKLNAKNLCRDPQVAADWVNDELCHDTGTLEGLAGMLDRGIDLNSGKLTLKESAGEGGHAKVWVGHGTADLVTHCGASRKWVEALEVQDKEFKAYDGFYHVLHAEPGEDQMRFAKDVGDWILARSGKTNEQQGTSTGKLGTPRDTLEDHESRSKL